MKINIQTILFLSVFAIIAPQANAEEKIGVQRIPNRAGRKISRHGL
ncbi:hypothetical protein HZ994_09465 [Akkermansiaceae bacterium]|nr:hypothetical protein HZ994_09465 [Akkermansiaceae bacterium]